MIFQFRIITQILLVDINESLGISSNADSEANTPLTTAALLDLYSGCGGMSTGLCLGAGLAGLKLETVSFHPIVLFRITCRSSFSVSIIICFPFIYQRWAVDFNSHACKSFKSNHPHTEVDS
jgi:DNA (cytosine-5)-methyltransferase 1